MRYHLETIPVWDAVKKDGECPLCALAHDLERQAVESMLGGAVMEPDQRVETNRLGFCARHLGQLYAEKNRLGLGLMLHTHLGELAGAQREIYAELLSAVKAEAGSGAVKRARAAVGHSGGSARAARAAADKLGKRAETCFVCDRIGRNLARYRATVAFLWKSDADFAAALSAGKGFCFPHAAELLHSAADELNGADLRGFLTLIAELQEKKAARLAAELEWFTLKFDWRNQDKPWGDSKDALPRTMDALRGASPRVE